MFYAARSHSDVPVGRAGASTRPFFAVADGCTLGRAVTAEEDIATVAAQLAALTRHVEELERQINERATTQRVRAEAQQERIDLAARELADVSQRLQAAAVALRDAP